MEEHKHQMAYHERQMADHERRHREHLRWTEVHERKKAWLDGRIKHAVRLAVKEGRAERAKRRELDETMRRGATATRPPDTDRITSRSCRRL